jgi:type IX secretion system PorP/SprF family membrane protein
VQFKLFLFSAHHINATHLKFFTRLSFFLLLIVSIHASAQDIHFSMFYASPLNLNPALTGINDGTYRAAAIYRNQWRNVSTPFVTYSASFDIKLLQTKLPNDIFGVGGMFVGDKSGDGKLSVSSGMISAAFHKGLDKDHKHFIGIGVQLGYTQKSLKWQQLAFPSQFSGTDFNLNQNNGESFGKPNVGYFDMQAGLLHQSTFNDVVGMMTGITVYHLVQPKESFINQKVKLPLRITVHEGLRIKLIKNLYLTPNFIFQYQNKAQEINFGTSLEYHMPAGKSELVGSIGGWYRLKDAAIISAGIEYYKVRGLFAYDINASNLKPATNGGRGAFELAIIYTGFIKSKSLNYPILVPCPMM